MSVLEPGQILNEKYEIERELGSGGFATVFKASDLTLQNRSVAIKVLHKIHIHRSDVLKRFLNEADFTNQVQNEHICCVHETGEVDGIPFLVMPFVAGRSLKELLEERGQIELSDTLSITAQILDGLHAAHSAGLIHRDIKPSNIMIRDAEQGKYFVHILDFGVAKYVLGDDTTDQTQTGDILGAWEYMSPEQFNATKGVDSRTDLWSVNVILYQMISGISPFKGPTRQATYNRVTNIKYNRLSAQSCPHFPFIEDIVSKQFAENIDDRFNSADEMAGAIRKKLEESLSRIDHGTDFPAEDQEEDALPSMRSWFHRNYRILIFAVTAISLVVMIVSLGVKIDQTTDDKGQKQTETLSDEVVVDFDPVPLETDNASDTSAVEETEEQPQDVDEAEDEEEFVVAAKKPVRRRRKKKAPKPAEEQVLVFTEPSESPRSTEVEQEEKPPPKLEEMTHPDQASGIISELRKAEDINDTRKRRSEQDRIFGGMLGDVTNEEIDSKVEHLSNNYRDLKGKRNEKIEAAPAYVAAILRMQQKKAEEGAEYFNLDASFSKLLKMINENFHDPEAKGCDAVQRMLRVIDKHTRVERCMQQSLKGQQCPSKNLSRNYALLKDKVVNNCQR